MSPETSLDIPISQSHPQQLTMTNRITRSSARKTRSCTRNNRVNQPPTSTRTIAKASIKASSRKRASSSNARPAIKPATMRRSQPATVRVAHAATVEAITSSDDETYNNPPCFDGGSSDDWYDIDYGHDPT